MGVWTSTPHDATAGAVLTAAQWDATVRDGFNAFGAMTSYTPSLTGFTQGNGTVTGGYTQVQKTVLFWAKFTFGSTSAAASASPSFTVPVTAASGFAAGRAGLDGTFIDTGSNTYAALARWETTSTVSLSILGTNGVRTVPSTTTPFTWTTSDVVMVHGWYEAA